MITIIRADGSKISDSGNSGGDAQFIRCSADGRKAIIHPDYW